MGWGSGVHVLDDTLRLIRVHLDPTEDQLTALATVLIQSFMDNDCDTFDDSDYTSHFWFRKALWNSGWYRNDQWNTYCETHYLCSPCVECGE